MHTYTVYICTLIVRPCLLTTVHRGWNIYHSLSTKKARAAGGCSCFQCCELKQIHAETEKAERLVVGLKGRSILAYWDGARVHQDHQESHELHFGVEEDPSSATTTLQASC